MWKPFVFFGTDFEVSCFTYEGIDAIKSALRCGLELSTEELPIRINLIAPPLFVMTTSTLERQDGIEALQAALDAIRTHIETQDGKFEVKMAPKVVSDTEEAELRKQMEELELANKEVSGDEDSEEESDEDSEEDDEVAGDDP